MKKGLVLKIGFSSTFAFLTGLGMMPIFDDDVKSLTTDALDWEDNKYLSPIIAINTLVVFSLLANYLFLKYLMRESGSEESKDESGKLSLLAAKSVSVCASLAPVSQLWVVELENKEYVDSEGFDEYIAWAMATSLPILLHESMLCYSALKAQLKDNLTQINLNSVGDNVFVYIPTLLAIPGRFISYYYSTYFLAKKIGLPEELSIVSGIIIGGVLGSAVLGVAEYRSLKSLFENKEASLDKLRITFGAVCALEGALLTLPMVATGISAIEDQPVLIKGVLYYPLFISSTVLRGSSLYEAFMGNCNIIKDIFCTNPVGDLEELDAAVNIVGEVYDTI